MEILNSKIRSLEKATDSMIRHEKTLAQILISVGELMKDIKVKLTKRVINIQRKSSRKACMAALEKRAPAPLKRCRKCWKSRAALYGTLQNGEMATLQKQQRMMGIKARRLVAVRTGRQHTNAKRNFVPPRLHTKARFSYAVPLTTWKL